MRLIGLIVLAVVLIGGVLLLVTSCGSKSSRKPEPPAIKVETLLARLQPLTRFDALKVSVAGIVSCRQPAQRWWQGESRIVLLTRGEAIYAIDLGKAELRCTPGRVHLRLPDPALADSWVDHSSSQIWAREQRGSASAGMELDQQAWRAAIEMVRNAAAQEQYVQIARTQAEQLVRELTRQVAPEATIEVAWGGP